MKKRFLVVAPHPDDAELGIGGTIIKLKKQGHTVSVIDLTSGEPTPCGTLRKRKNETVKATKILNIDQRINLNLQNRYLFDSKEARLLLAEQIRLLKPAIIFAPHPEDTHPDHSAASKIAEGARFYAKYTKLRLKGTPHYSQHLFYYFCSHLKAISEIHFFINTSQTFKEKMKAIKCYKSQFIDNHKNKFIFNYIENRDKYFGSLINCNFAEGIYSKEAFKIEDITTLL